MRQARPRLYNDLVLLTFMSIARPGYATALRRLNVSAQAAAVMPFHLGLNVWPCTLDRRPSQHYADVIERHFVCRPSLQRCTCADGHLAHSSLHCHGSCVATQLPATGSDSAQVQRCATSLRIPQCALPSKFMHSYELAAGMRMQDLDAPLTRQGCTS